MAPGRDRTGARAELFGRARQNRGSCGARLDASRRHGFQTSPVARVLSRREITCGRRGDNSPARAEHEPAFCQPDRKQLRASPRSVSPTESAWPVAPGDTPPQRERRPRGPDDGDDSSPLLGSNAQHQLTSCPNDLARMKREIQFFPNRKIRQVATKHGLDLANPVRHRVPVNV